ncbi:MAG TPA: sialidase family protein, partial [Blastocatellia bacterium]|nr:sialidase family protein [Blastocatellia bacterium]
MRCSLQLIVVRFVLALTLLPGLGSLALAQHASRNVNMVSGTGWPGGDPFLQRQNEPSLAVSSRNALHLLAGANDYRTVDMPGLAEGKVVGDAWLGLFKSYDGGQTWQSTLLPGYPQDTSAAGMASPLKGLPGAADPVVRAGANGLLYYSGIAFDRADNGPSKFFVARFIDNNNESSDPIKYLGTAVIDIGTAGKFVDKPWMAVDIPRAGATSATIDGQTFPVGNVYVSWSILQGTPPDEHTRIYFARSTDGGVTWSKPDKLSESVGIGQGTAIGIDPVTGAVYVTWRRLKKIDPLTGLVVQTDAVMVAKSTDGGKTFSKPLVIAEINPFDQSTSDVSMRTTAYPTIAVDHTGRAYVAWSQRDVYDGMDARIVMSTSTNGTTWSPPFIVESPPTRGHQIMPALSFAGGKLMMIYYDLREDHTFGLFSLIAGSGGLFNETRFPFGDLADPGANSAKVFTTQLMDTAPVGMGTLKRRHTLDVRATQADPAATPAFSPAVKVSQYKFGSRPGSNVVEQLQFNVPNLPMFKKGTAPFMGDYIDLAAQTIIPNGSGGWTYNTAPSNSVVFHAVWTDNRDVVPPRINPPATAPDWKNYTPPNSAVKPSISRIDGTVVVPCIEGQTGSRNQNIYTSRITQGLFVGSPANAKLLNTESKRSFVAYVQNATG